MKIINPARKLREEQIKQTAQIQRYAHAKHIYRIEASIAKYQKAMWKIMRSRVSHVAAGHQPSIDITFQRLRTLAEGFIRQACDSGYHRGLRDLHRLGWLRAIVGPVEAPEDLVKSLSAENDGYLEGFAQDMSDAGVTEAQVKARLAQYSHWLWVSSERAYSRALKGFSEAHNA